MLSQVFCCSTRALHVRTLQLDFADALYWMAIGMNRQITEIHVILSCGKISTIKAQLGIHF